MRLDFVKMQGAGNDFVVVESDNVDADWGQLAVAICDRHYGVGADGLLVIGPSNSADIRMRILNADGSEASACGNGTRCVVKHYVERHPSMDSCRRVTVETLSGIREAWYSGTDSDTAQVRVAMGRPQAYPASARRGRRADRDDHPRVTPRSVSACGRKIEITVVSFGNPHAVHFTNAPLVDFPLAEIGSDLDHRVFPEGINFEIARVIGRGCAEARVWEHGVGETLACGSGACSIAVAGNWLGILGGEVEARLPGGLLSVQWDGKGEVFLTGPAETVFQGEWAGVDGRRSELQQISTKNEVLA